jgi:hypothetical protein
LEIFKILNRSWVFLDFRKKIFGYHPRNLKQIVQTFVWQLEIFRILKQIGLWEGSLGISRILDKKSELLEQFGNF